MATLEDQEDAERDIAEEMDVTVATNTIRNWCRGSSRIPPGIWYDLDVIANERINQIKSICPKFWDAHAEWGPKEKPETMFRKDQSDGIH